VNPTKTEVLEAVVVCYDNRGRHVSAKTVAEHLEAEQDVLADALHTLENCEMIAGKDGQYRPTITGREFLELDLDEGFAIVDTLCE